MKENDIDKLIGRRLGEYREEPAPELFSRIEKSLAQASVPVKPRRRFLYYISGIGAAAVILAGLAIGYTTLRTGDGAEDGIADIPYVTSPGNITESVTVTDNAGNQAPSVRTDTKKVPTAARPGEENLSDMIKRLIRENPVLDGAADADPTFALHSREEILEEIRLEMPVIEFIDITAETSRATGSDTGHAVSAEEEWEAYRRYWAQVLEEDKKPKRDRKGLATSLYAGNFGAGNGDYRSNNAYDLYANKMAVMESSGVDFSPSAILNSGTNDYNPSENTLVTRADGETELVHKMPVNFGLTLAYPVTDNLRIVSGLNYSYLTSSSRQNTEAANYRMSRDIHYLGIPLGVSYSFYNTRWMSLYVYGGGMIEKAVSAREVTTYGFDSGNTEQSKNIKIKGVQPSVKATLGASFNIARAMSIYIEPGVAYYFEQIDTLPTYRTENPTSFSLTVGIRFGL